MNFISLFCSQRSSGIRFFLVETLCSLPADVSSPDGETKSPEQQVGVEGGFKVRFMSSECVSGQIYGGTSSCERPSDGLMRGKMQSDERLSDGRIVMDDREVRQVGWGGGTPFIFLQQNT